MTTTAGPEGPGEVQPTTTRTAARSLWEQPSFLVTLGLCVLWLTAFATNTQSAQESRPVAIFLLVATVLGYALYRRKRGWKALPTTGWLPSRRASRRHWIGLGLYISLLVFLVAGSAMRQTTSQGNSVPAHVPDAPWTKSLTATTCGDWQSEMSDRQRQTFAGALLAYDLAQPHGAALDQAKASDYISMITDTCKDESPSSLVVQ